MNAPALPNASASHATTYTPQFRPNRPEPSPSNQLEKIARPWGAASSMRSSPREGPVEEIGLAQAVNKARRIIQRTRAHMALEEQTEGLRSETQMERTGSGHYPRRAAGFLCNDPRTLTKPAGATPLTPDELLGSSQTTYATRGEFERTRRREHLPRV